MTHKWTSQWHNQPQCEGMEQSILERIVMLRRQVLLHSYIYYSLDENVIADHEFDRRGRELFDLQKEHGWNVNFYDSIFKHWQGQSGFWLPTNKGCDEHVNRVAARVLAHEKLNRQYGGQRTDRGTLPPAVETPEYKQAATDIFQSHRPDVKNNT